VFFQVALAVMVPDRLVVVCELSSSLWLSLLVRGEPVYGLPMGGLAPAYS
jgi:hypothetical protein